VKRNEQKLARQRAILIALSEDLSLPLVQIKTGLELIDSDNLSAQSLAEQKRLMALSTETGLHLVEAYKLLLKTDEIINLPLETIAVGSVLEDVAHRVSPYAKQFDTDLRIDIQGRFAPVIAHAPSLATALEVLSASLIAAQAAQSQRKRYQLVLGAHRSADGFVMAGAFSDVEGLSDYSLRAARALVGQARQPITQLPPGSISGILVADMLCAALWQPLKSSAHRSYNGLATGLPLSSQLQFV
jgi:hypothetical protein